MTPVTFHAEYLLINDIKKHERMEVLPVIKIIDPLNAKIVELSDEFRILHRNYVGSLISLSGKTNRENVTVATSKIHIFICRFSDFQHHRQFQKSPRLQ